MAYHRLILSQTSRINLMDVPFKITLAVGDRLQEETMAGGQRQGGRLGEDLGERGSQDINLEHGGQPGGSQVGEAWQEFVSRYDQVVVASLEHTFLMAKESTSFLPKEGKVVVDINRVQVTIYKFSMIKSGKSF